jgi:hypothetical protein
MIAGCPNVLLLVTRPPTREAHHPCTPQPASIHPLLSAPLELAPPASSHLFINAFTAAFSSQQPLPPLLNLCIAVPAAVPLAA